MTKHLEDLLPAYLFYLLYITMFKKRVQADEGPNKTSNIFGVEGHYTEPYITRQSKLSNIS